MGVNRAARHEQALEYKRVTPRSTNNHRARTQGEHGERKQQDKTESSTSDPVYTTIQPLDPRKHNQWQHNHPMIRNNQLLQAPTVSGTKTVRATVTQSTTRAQNNKLHTSTTTVYSMTTTLHSTKPTSAPACKYLLAPGRIIGNKTNKTAAKQIEGHTKHPSGPMKTPTPGYISGVFKVTASVITRFTTAP